MARCADRTDVDIAMATYNGAPFLPDMLHSLANQTHSRFTLHVSDDGSTDNTLAIIRQASHHICINELPTVPRKGILRNFEAAISACTARYVALADQDDFWLPGKIERLHCALRSLEEVHGDETPLLVFSDIQIVDSELNVVHNSFFRSTLKSSNALSFKDYVFSSHVPGCAMVFNRALVDRALPFPAVDLHDHWLIQVATLFGRVSYVDYPLIKYRQHGGNGIGLGSASRAGLPRLLSMASNWDPRVRRLKWRRQSAAIRRSMSALRIRYGDLIPNGADTAIIDAIVENSPKHKLKSLLGDAYVGERKIDVLGMLRELSRPNSNSTGDL